MRAIILAAGVGKRLGSAHTGPKCLLEFGGRSLLERHLDALSAAGVDDVTLVLGHEADTIRRALPAAAAGRVLCHYNPLYTLGSMLSLWSARQTLLSGDDVLVMDADVLYDPAIVQRLARSAAPNCFLLDRDFLPGDEPVKICLQGERIVEFRKQIAAGLTYNRVGESVGFFRFDAGTATRLARIVDRHAAREGRELPHEEALRELALSGEADIAVEDVTGLAWIEIDFPEDITRAAGDILPRIDGR